MQGHAEVIDYLNTLLTGELAARDHTSSIRACTRTGGFAKLYERLNHEMEEETQHDALLRRILLLEGTPRMRPDDIHLGQDRSGDARSRPEAGAPRARRLAKGIALCEKHKDFVTRDILRVQLTDTEEDHAYWLEQQLGLIAKMGLENYLQSQI